MTTLLQPPIWDCPLSRQGDQVFLSLYGTGFRSGISATATVGGVSVPVYGFAPVKEYQGLDAVNIGPLPRTLAGRGVVDVAFTVGAKAANLVSVNIRCRIRNRFAVLLQ